MDINWDDARLFLAVADAKSVSGAARSLRMTQPTVSRRLAALEDSLGFALVARTAQGTSLTLQGERMLEPARKMAEWAAELSRAADTVDHKPHGIVRVTAPPGVAFDFLVPIAAHLKKAAPAITLQVLSSVDYLDLARGEADLALRLRAPGDDLALIRSFADRVSAFASPGYIARLPKKPKLTDLDFIAWAPPLDRLSPNPELAALIPNWKPAFAADDFLVQLRACEAGLGCMVIGTARHRWSKLKLARVPIELPGKTTLHLVSARRALEVSRVRLVAEVLEAELASCFS